MSLETWGILASVGTFLVITVSAIAAVVQLRHLRFSNQIAALAEISRRMESEEFLRDLRFVREELPVRLADPSYRAGLMGTAVGDEYLPVIRLSNLFAEMGLLVSHQLIDEDLACDWFGGMVIRYWDDMKDAIAVRRRTRGPEFLDKFEYLVVRARARNPNGTYPANEKRLPIEDRWRDEDGLPGSISQELLIVPESKEVSQNAQ